MATHPADNEAVLQGPETQRILARAGRVAQTAVALHRYAAGRESEAIHRCGRCAEACAYVSALPWGRQACRRSREKHAKLARQRRRPVPYICHMGFACVSVCLPPTGGGDACAITFGPFCPAEAPDALDEDARSGLAQLEHATREELPFTLDDIPRVPSEVVPETAAWTAETLTEQPRAARDDVSAAGVDDADAAQAQRRRGRSSGSVRDPYDAHAVLAALAGNDQNRLRKLVRRVINERPSRGRPGATPDVLRDRTLALTGAVLEAAERAGLPTQEARARLAGLPHELRTLEATADLARASLRVLAPLKRRALQRPSEDAAAFAALDRYVQAHLGGGLTLGAAAAHLGVPPSTLTRRLQQRYGLSFTEYAGRVRVDRAKDLLIRTGLSVEAIARRVGLKDGSHLRKLFHKFEGQAPSAFRGRQNAVSARQPHSS